MKMFMTINLYDPILPFHKGTQKATMFLLFSPPHVSPHPSHVNSHADLPLPTKSFPTLSYKLRTCISYPRHKGKREREIDTNTHRVSQTHILNWVFPKRKEKERKLQRERALHFLNSSLPWLCFNTIC